MIILLGSHTIEQLLLLLLPFICWLWQLRNAAAIWAICEFTTCITRHAAAVADPRIKKLHSHSKELITSCKQRCHLPSFLFACCPLHLPSSRTTATARLPHKKQRKQNRCDAQKWNCRRKIENAAHTHTEREISAVVIATVVGRVVASSASRGRGTA